MNFICVSCQKSLLSDSKIMCDVHNRQYCVRCWREDEKKRSKETEKKFPLGSKVVWMDALSSKGRVGRKVVATVLECMYSRVRIRFGNREKIVEADELQPHEEI